MGLDVNFYPWLSLIRDAGTRAVIGFILSAIPADLVAISADANGGQARHVLPSADRAADRIAVPGAAR